MVAAAALPAFAGIFGKVLGSSRGGFNPLDLVSGGGGGSSGGGGGGGSGGSGTFSESTSSQSTATGLATGKVKSRQATRIASPFFVGPGAGAGVTSTLTTMLLIGGALIVAATALRR